MQFFQGIFSQLPTLETERLILRPLRMSDARDLFAYARDPQVSRHVLWETHESLRDSRQFLRGAIRQYRQGLPGSFAITLKESGKVIGEIDAYPEAGEPHEDENTPKDTFSPCWMLNLNYTGKGYAYEAAHAFFDYLFNEKGARRIYAYTEDTNLPSQHLCEKLGMRREGLFLEFISFVNDPDGSPRYENTYQYAILKKEWNKG